MIDLVIDPGRAFGTGAHPTTRLCLELLLELEPRGSLCDLGCGSGVLSIAAARLGFAPGHGARLRPRWRWRPPRPTRATTAWRSTRVERAEPARASPPPAADVVVANLMRPLLLRVAELMAAAAAVPDRVGAAGGRGGRGGHAFAPLREQRRLSATRAGARSARGALSRVRPAYT